MDGFPAGASLLVTQLRRQTSRSWATQLRHLSGDVAARLTFVDLFTATFGQPRSAPSTKFSANPSAKCDGSTVALEEVGVKRAFH
jgi:hypothetical protein